MNKLHENLCCNCRFWFPLPYKVDNFEEGYVGHCHRFPPVKFIVNNSTVETQDDPDYWCQPSTTGDDSCGEWQPE